MNLVAAAVAAGAERLVAQSIAYAYAPGGSPVKGEEDLLHLDAPYPWRRSVEAVASLERQVREAALTGVVLRYGYFYGPGTPYNEGGALRAAVQRRRFPVVGSGAVSSRSCTSTTPRRQRARARTRRRRLQRRRRRAGAVTHVASRVRRRGSRRRRRDAFPPWRRGPSPAPTPCISRPSSRARRMRRPASSSGSFRRYARLADGFAAARSP